MMRFLRALFVSVVVVMLVVSSGVRLASGAGAAKSSAGMASQDPERVPVLILFKRQPGPAEEALVRGLGGTIKYTYHLVPAIAASVPQTAVAALQANPNVRVVEPDGLFHVIDHSTTTGDGELNNTWGVKHIGSGTVHASGNKGTGIKVAVLDTGIDTDHPDLNYDTACSQSFVDGETLDDGHGHGTHVAGTVAALDNNVASSVVGVAPSAVICVLKVLSNSGSGSYSDVVAALQFIVSYNNANSSKIRVTNNSYGSSGDPGVTVKEAFDNAYAAGVLHIAAAGNSGNPPGKGDNCIYPARWDSLVAVAATTQDDTRASFSSTCQELELAAPGYQIRSTVPGGGYDEYSGTSMASPHVAGTAALAWYANSGYSKEQIRSLLQETAIDLGAAGRDTHYGFGLVDAAAAAGASTSTTGTVAGTVTDSTTGSAISGATVSVDTGQSTTTLDNGTYTLTGVPTGTRTVTASKSGYNSAQQDVMVNGGETTTANFALTPSSSGGTLNVVVDTDKDVYAMGERVTISVVVTDGTNPVEGAAVHVDVTTASERQYGADGTTDANGMAQFSFKTKKPDGTGTYTVDATASKSGYTGGSHSATFTVNET